MFAFDRFVITRAPVNAEFLIVILLAPFVMVPPIPPIPDNVKPLSPEPKSTCIVGEAPEAAITVMALFVPDHVP